MQGKKFREGNFEEKNVKGTMLGKEGIYKMKIR